MNQKKKAKYIGVFSALLVHVLIVLLLLGIGFTLPPKQEEGGVPVMLGEVPAASGLQDPSLVEVDVMPQEALAQTEAVSHEVEQDMLTQEVEETVAIPPKKQTEKVQKKTPEKKPEKKKPVKPEKTEAEKAAEARKQAELAKKEAEARAEKARKQAEEEARRKVAGAFGKGAKMTDKGTSQGTGLQGKPTGNAMAGTSSESAGYGSFDLGGRSLGKGGLPRPNYVERDEGKVVVDITVNPAGIVIATSINRHTNTVNPALRKAAEDAARKARFNAVSGLDNQRGTITYYFNFK